MTYRRAFTLTEVLMATIVLGLAMLPLFMVFSKGSAGTVQTRDEVMGTGYVTELLALAQCLSYDDSFLDPKTKSPCQSLPLPSVGGEALGKAIDPRFKRYFTVKELTAGADVPYTYKVLIAEVDWLSNGISRNLQMTGMVYKGKP